MTLRTQLLHDVRNDILQHDVTYVSYSMTYVSYSMTFVRKLQHDVRKLKHDVRKLQHDVTKSKSKFIDIDLQGAPCR